MNEEENRNEVPQANVNYDSVGTKIVYWLKKNVVNLFLAGLCIYFVFSGSVEFVPNDMDLKRKIIYIFTKLFFGVVVISLVGEGGYASAKESDKFVSTLERSRECQEQALPLRKEAELYVSDKIDLDIKNERINILAKASINYEEVFNENNVPYPLKRLKKEFTKKQLKSIKQAIHIKKVPFVLFGFTAVKSVGRKQAPNELKRRKSKFASSFIIKAIMAIASGSIAFSFIGISVSNLIYSLFELAMWFGSGLITRISNYNFIINVVRDYELERTWYLKEFLKLTKEEQEKLTERVSLEESKKNEILRLTYENTKKS